MLKARRVAFSYVLTLWLLGAPGTIEPASGDTHLCTTKQSNASQCAALSMESRAISYVESSTGLSSPQWDGGRCEVEMADVNLDGRVDLVTIGDHGSPYVNSGEHGIMVYFGDGSGAWQVFMNGDFGYGGIAVGDVDNDGLPDVGYAMHHNYSGVDFGDQLIEVALGDGTGRNWTPWDDGLASQGESYGMFATDLGDVDNDGDLDIAATSFGGGNPLMVYLNNGDGTWTFSTSLSGGNPDEIVFFGDINKDGNLDIATSYQNGSIFFGSGDGQFYDAEYNLPTGGIFGHGGLSIGDVDGDGGMDLAYVSGGVKVWIFDEVDSLWVDFSGNLPGGGNYDLTQLCDMNADGFCDVLAAGSGHVTVWTGNGRGTWSEAASYINSHDSDSPFEAFRAGGDADHNGFPDIVHVTEEGGAFNSRNHIRFYRETSSPSILTIMPTFPRGGEVVAGGSARFTDWLSGVPGAAASAVRIELSTTGSSGPWATMGDSLPNNGRLQWMVPSGLTSVECFVKYTVRTLQDSAVAVTPGPFTIDDGPRDVQLTLDPINPPIVIPPSGGSFDYDLHLVNNETARQSFNAWVMVTMPDGGTLGPIIGPLTLGLPGGGSVDRVRTETVPGEAPAGSYTYRAYVGIYPNEMWSGDGFAFTKSP